MNAWYFLDSGAGDPAFNMAVDHALLESMPRLTRPVLRFYGWSEPAASFGYFQAFAEVSRLTPLRPLVRRPTAGGFVPHDADWTYSLAFPPTDDWYSLTATESYRRVHEWLRGAFNRLGVQTELAPCRLNTGAGQCFVGYQESDLLWNGRKIAGAAQRRRRDGLLVQGSVQPPPLPGLSRAEWQDAMRNVAESASGVKWEVWEGDAALEARVTELKEQKYSQPAYHQKR
jgi:lipoate-protein ligase A